MSNMFTWLLRNANVVDGTGQSTFRANVALQGEKIAALGPDVTGEAERFLDLQGRYLAPGFIDPHSHADFVATLPLERQGELQKGKVYQGITTEIVGNCGLGPAPVDLSGLVPKVVAWMAPKGVSWTWNSLPEYLDQLEQRGVLLNIGTLQAHGPLRLEAKGLASGESSQAEREQMKKRLAEALEAGAFGLSSGLIYPPGMYSSTPELVELAQLVAGKDGVYTSHIRGSSELLLPSVEELLEIGVRTGVRVHHSHSEAFGRAHWTKVEKMLEREAGAARHGQAVTFDMFPYTAAATMMLAIYPPWALEGGVPRLLDRLRDTEQRRRIEASVNETVPSWPPWRDGGWPHNLVMAAGWPQVYIGRVGSEKNRDVEGLNLQELADRTGKTPFDAVSDLMIEEDGVVSQLIFGVSGDRQDDHHMVELMRHPLGAFCTDASDYGEGLPHPAAYSSFTRVLAEYVQKRHVLSLEEAIRKMTSYPAGIFSLTERGRLAPGYQADLVVFDPDRLEDRADYAHPRRLPGGIESVFVNGTPVLLEGDYRPTLCGKVMRH